MMRDAVLLDACALLWLGMGSGLLSQAAREAIEETEPVGGYTWTDVINGGKARLTGAHPTGSCVCA